LNSLFGARARWLLFSADEPLGHFTPDSELLTQWLGRVVLIACTTYAHYRDKEDLLLAGFEDIRSALAAEQEAAEQAAGATSEFLQPLRVVFRHVEGHRHVWQPLARKGGAEVVTRIMQDNVTDLVREHLRSQFPGVWRNQPQLEAAVQYIASACTGLLIWWLDNDIPYSAEELYATFRQLTTQGVRRFLTST
jgi:AcrR family transcriptional regulator